MPNSQRRRRTLEDYDQRLVVFDTNVLEARYLAPLLRGEPCHDFNRLREHAPGYRPSLFIKSYYEICQHVKLGTKTFPWCTPDFGYPGGMATGREIMRRLSPPPADENLYWWFNMAEEWRGTDWEEHEAEMSALALPSARDAVVHEVRVRRDFANWKFSLSAFCQRIWEVLEGELTILTQHDVYGCSGEFLDEVFSLEQDLAELRLVPNEDLEIVTAALACRASAFVTGEKAMLSQTALSVSLNWKTAFVHPDRLSEALAEDFLVRWDTRLSSPRNADG